MHNTTLNRGSPAVRHSLAPQGRPNSRLQFRGQQACQPAQQHGKNRLACKVYQHDYAPGGSGAAALEADPCPQQQQLHPQYVVVQPQLSQKGLSSTAPGADIKTLLHKNSATETLIELRAARIATLHSVLASHGLESPVAATVGAAGADASLQEQQQQQRPATAASAPQLLSDVSSCSYQAVQQRNQQLMGKSRAQNVQIQAMESVLTAAGVALPALTLDSTSLSSCSSCDIAIPCGEGSLSAAASVSAATVPARVPVVAACVIPKSKQVRRHTIRCEFQVHCDTQLGDHVMVVGSHPALGSWDAEHGGALALTQHADSRGVWRGVMSLDWPLRDYSSKMVCFKVVLQRADGNMEWQQGASLEMVLGPLMGHHVTPAVAVVHYEGSLHGGLPLNYLEACAAYYNMHYDAEVPEAYARKQAAQEVQQSIKRMRAAATPSPAGTGC